MTKNLSCCNIKQKIENENSHFKKFFRKIFRTF
nr:MAG TPA: hypothetical protein [Caudoviricetes sp.]